MKPFKRPDSAGSKATKITHYSQNTNKDLNASKFSQTFTTGVKYQDSKNNDFAEYVKQKDKDPRFKGLLQPIKQQVKKQQTKKINIKPFEKRNSKVIDKSEKKQQQDLIKKQKPQLLKQQQQQNLNKSQRFADKNKKKFSSLKISQSNQKKEPQNKTKPKINFDGFSVNQPGKKPVKYSQKTDIKKSPQKKQQIKTENNSKKKIQMTRQEQLHEQNRSKLYNDLSNFVEASQIRNAQYYPQRYQQFIDTKFLTNVEDLQKINLYEFLQTPTQTIDYAKAQKRIKDYDKKIQDAQNRVYTQNDDTSSINLSRIIDSSKNQTQQQLQQSRIQSQVALSSMTASQLQKRNLFLTEILKGKISKEQIQELQKLQRQSSHLNEDQSQLQQDFMEMYDVDMKSQIDMKKKKSNNRILERNRVQAAGGVYRDCDYLSDFYKERLQNLLNGQMEANPFQQTQQQIKKNQQLDNQIQYYRRVYADQNEQQPQMINQSVLPKDPLLRKQAQIKILKDKINSVNSRLKEADKVVVNKTKIQMMVQKYKETTKLSKYSQQLMKQKNRQFQQQKQNLQQAQRIIQNAKINKQSVEKLLQQMNQKFQSLSQDVRKIRQMNEQQMRQQELIQLKNKKQQIQKKQRSFNQTMDLQMRQFQRNAEQIRLAIKALSQIDEIQRNNISYENYDPNQTIESLDKMIIQRKQAADKISKILNEDPTNLLQQ